MSDHDDIVLYHDVGSLRDWGSSGRQCVAAETEAWQKLPLCKSMVPFVRHAELVSPSRHKVADFQLPSEALQS